MLIYGGIIGPEGVISSKINTATGFIKALESGTKHLVLKRFTFRYPEEN